MSLIRPCKSGRRRAGQIDAMTATGCLPMIAILAAILLPVFAQARDRAMETSSESNLKQIGLAITMYAYDHSGKYPSMDTMDHFTASITKYVPQTIMIEPGDDQAYVLNAHLSGVDGSKIENPEAAWVAKDPDPHADGMVAVLYADGHVQLDKP